MNTVDFLGFVGIFRDFFYDEQRHFAGPVSMFVEEALAPTEKPVDISVMDFVWKLIRYYPWRKSGPFDYVLNQYTGVGTKKNDENRFNPNAMIASACKVTCSIL